MGKLYASTFNKYRFLFVALSLLLGLIQTSDIYSQTPVIFNNPANNGFPANTWTVPAGVTSVKVEVWGGGGGGGGAAGGAGQGGGGGAYEIKTFTVNPGDNYTLTIGSGGVGGDIYNSINPAAGLPTTFTGAAGSVTAAGGNAGQVGNGGPGTGGGGGGTHLLTGGFDGGSGLPAASGGNGTGGGGGAGNSGNGQDGTNTTAGIGGIGTPNIAPYVGGNGGAAVITEAGGNPGSAPGGGGSGAPGATPGTTCSGVGCSVRRTARRRVSWSTASLCMSANSRSDSVTFAVENWSLYVIARFSAIALGRISSEPSGAVNV